MVDTEKLAARLSELDLSSLRGQLETGESGYGPQYDIEKLMRLRPSIERGSQQVTSDNGAEGLKTPPEPIAPPPTPASHPTSPKHLPVKELRSLDETLITPIAEADKEGEEDKKIEFPVPLDASSTQKSEQTKKNEPSAAASSVQNSEQKKKSSGKTKKVPATGFEEFYADPPITPAEYDEESEIYAPERSFPERIETCIQRYRNRRKLDSFRSNIFSKWLSLGGINAGTPNMFTGGLDKETLESSTAKEIAAMQATDYIRSGIHNAKFYDPANPEGWVVDFTGVMKGFLSHRALEDLNVSTEKDIKQTVAVLRNFLNYLLAHRVCPEYEEDVLEARRICNLGEDETLKTTLVRPLLPGQFNIAASILYGGRYKEPSYGAADVWGLDNSNSAGWLPIDAESDIAKAEQLFKTSLVFVGGYKLFMKTMGADVHIVKSEYRSFEIADIHRADSISVEDYHKVNREQGYEGEVKALGIVTFKPWKGPAMEEEDMTDDEDNESLSTSEEAVLENFWLEDEALQHCFLGMKLEVLVRELNIGIKFFDHVQGVYCSFHTYLPNEKMAFWKEPLPNERPPPTEEDPDAEEKMMSNIMEREQEETEKDILVEKVAKAE